MNSVKNHISTLTRLNVAILNTTNKYQERLANMRSRISVGDLKNFYEQYSYLQKLEEEFAKYAQKTQKILKEYKPPEPFPGKSYKLGGNSRFINYTPQNAVRQHYTRRKSKRLRSTV